MSRAAESGYLCMRARDNSCVFVSCGEKGSFDGSEKGSQSLMSGVSVSERLGHRDHAGSEVLLLAGCHGHQLADGLPCRGAQGAQQLAMMHEVRAKELRDGEDPLDMADVGDHLVL